MTIKHSAPGILEVESRQEPRSLPPATRQRLVGTSEQEVGGLRQCTRRHLFHTDKRRRRQLQEVIDLISEHDLEILRCAIRSSGAMRRWRRSCHAATESMASEYAKSCALRAKTLYEAALINNTVAPMTDMAKRKIAFAAITDATPSKANVVKKKKPPKPLRKKSRSPYRQRLQNRPEDQTARPTAASRNRYRPSHVVVGARIETPSYVRKIDEGIGGSREQAENERHKLSSEMRKRAWDLED